MNKLSCCNIILILIILIILYISRVRIEYFKEIKNTFEYKNQVREILENILMILYNNKYTPIIFYGTLLGIIRDKDIIDNDYDSDILLSYDDFERLKNDKTTNNEINKLYKIHKQNTNNRKNRWAISYKKDGSRFYGGKKIPHMDIFQYYKKDKCCYVTSWGNNIDIVKNYEKSKYNFNSSYTDNIIKIDAPKQFKTVKHFYVPKNYKELLTELYGDWKVKNNKHANRKICKHK